MSNLAFIIALYGTLIVGSMGLGWCGRWALDLWKARRALRAAAVRLPFEQAFPIIDEWANRPGNEWYFKDLEMRAAAIFEHERLMRYEPGLTLDENLEKVSVRVRKRYPAAFQTLH